MILGIAVGAAVGVGQGDVAFWTASGVPVGSLVGYLAGLLKRTARG